MTKCQSNLSSEKFYLIFLEAFDLNQVSEKFSTFDKPHNKVNTEFILENIFHIDKERMFNSK